MLLGAPTGDTNADARYWSDQNASRPVPSSAFKSAINRSVSCIRVVAFSADSTTVLTRPCRRLVFHFTVAQSTT